VRAYSSSFFTGPANDKEEKEEEEAKEYALTGTLQTLRLCLAGDSLE
jgi:hypothetical protein